MDLNNASISRKECLALWVCVCVWEREREREREREGERERDSVEYYSVERKKWICLQSIVMNTPPWCPWQHNLANQYIHHSRPKQGNSSKPSSLYEPPVYGWRSALSWSNPLFWGGGGLVLSAWLMSVAHKGTPTMTGFIFGLASSLIEQ